MQQRNPSPSSLLTQISHQTSNTPPHLVYVLDILSIRFGGHFTPEISGQLQRFHNLQMLTLNDCGIVGLDGFPHLPNLIRLDMVFNGIGGGELGRLGHCRHIQTLMLGANKIENIQDLQHLKPMANLLQLDLINNPVTRTPGYRQQTFTKFPSLLILDTLDRSGKDAYNNVTMMEAVHRIPEHLFSRGDQDQRIGGFMGGHVESREQLRRAISRLGSLEDAGLMGRKEKKKSKKVRKDEQNKLVRRKSFQFGTLFPTSRIRRLLKAKTSGDLRITRSAGVYLSAVLEYLTAQFLSIAGQEAQNQGRNRISPLILKDCVNSDGELGRLMRNAVFGVLGQ